MEKEKPKEDSPVGPHEQRFLDRLGKKYERSENAGQLRSFAIAAAVLLLFFSLSRWIPFGWLALLLVEVIGLVLFYQYKRFAGFKNRTLIKLWRHVRQQSEQSP